MEKKRIAIDMDEVLADSLGRYMEWYQRDYQIEIKREDLKGKTFPRGITAHQEVARAYPHRLGFFKDLGVMPDSQEVVKQLMEQYEVFIVTAAMEFPTSFIHKYEWLQEHFPFIPCMNWVFCGHKYMIQADYLIDDHPRNLRPFTGKGILFSAPHNLLETEFTRVNNWREVGEMLL